MTSEKVHLSSILPTSANVAPNARDRQLRRLTWAAKAAGASLLAYHLYANSGFDALNFFSGQGTQFVDSTVAGGISWWACPDITTTECAYLTVPRDYSNPLPNDTVSIFMRKIPATVEPKDYLGSILVNPGGPGGSGSAFVAGRGVSLSTMVDGRYDIIGFDPRGVNMTIPAVSCFETESQGIHTAYKLLQLGLPYGARGPKSLPAATRAASEHAYVVKLNATQAAAASACQAHGNNDMLASISTALVVQDMERIVEALGEDGLNFWGFSYGTILGSTFAAMRPNLVKRMILDGVSDADSYYNDMFQWGRDILTDSHKTLSGFLDSRASAGPDRCAFAKSTNGKASTSADLRSRLEGLYQRLREEPMPVPQSVVGPGVLTASDAKIIMFTGLYAPKGWPVLAQAVADAESGDAKAMYEALYGGFADLHPEEPDKNVFNRYMEKAGMMVTTSSIMCGDFAPADWKTLDDYIEYFHELSRIGPIGENVAQLFGFCRHWKIRPIQRYEGPWSVEDGLKKTRFPILYANLDADPVTPLSSAIKMSESFGNQSAVLLVQEGFGHSTLAHPSLCTAKIMRDYFVNGKVPAAGIRCKPEPGYLFPGKEIESVAVLSTEDRKLWRALDGLSDIARNFYRPL